MANKAFTMSVILTTLLALIVVTFSIFFQSNNRLLLDGSIKSVGRLLDIEYQIEKASTGNSLTDQSAIWVVQAKGGLEGKIRRRAEFVKADDDDLNDFEKNIADAFRTPVNLHGYVLYRAKIPLGKDSICSNTTCSIYLLVKADDSLVYIGIYKS